MTISMAWVRKRKVIEELIFLTDSRLRFGGEWDCCPKIIELSRGDCAICFAGDTAYSYPVMLQIQAYIDQFHGAKNRYLTLVELKTHLLKMLNNMVSHIHDLPKGIDTTPDVEFIFGGYCWFQKDFQIWLIHFDRSINRFTVRPAANWRGGNQEKKIALTGDYQEEVKTKLIEKLKGKGKIDKQAFDMEPFEVLRDMLRENCHTAIGGAPQMLTIRMNLISEKLAIYWPNKDNGIISVMGRPLLEYEKTDLRIIDPDTLKIDFFEA
jgi:hypothetical protein